MEQLFLVQVGRTVCEEEDRLDSLGGMPLCEEEIILAEGIAGDLESKSVTAIYTPSAVAEREVAGKIASVVSVPVHEDNGLSEIDYGLWQGLRIEELKRRQPRLQKQWMESPSGVRPPGGETLLEAQDRVWDAVSDIVSKNTGSLPVLVMRPVVLGLLKCRVAGDHLDEIWSHVRREPGMDRMNVELTGEELVLMEMKSHG